MPPQSFGRPPIPSYPPSYSLYPSTPPPFQHPPRCPANPSPPPHPQLLNTNRAKTTGRDGSLRGGFPRALHLAPPSLTAPLRIQTGPKQQHSCLYTNHPLPTLHTCHSALLLPPTPHPEFRSLLNCSKCLPTCLCLFPPFPPPDILSHGIVFPVEFETMLYYHTAFFTSAC